MNFRIKFAKYGTMKFISHLDVMRYFQKAIRRAGLPVMYSEGFNPHQIMSFASPLGVGQTSEAEYFDLALTEEMPAEELCDRLNQTMTEGMRILGAILLPEPKPQEKRETAMALVAASDYLVLLKDGYEENTDKEFLRREFKNFLSKSEILTVKKSKKTETEVNLAQFIFDFSIDGKTTPYSGEYDNGLVFYLLLSSGSVNNIKPDTVMEAFYAYLGREYNPYAYQLHRLETYADLALKKVSQSGIAERTAKNTMPERRLVPLMNYYTV
ncbi:MAG: TIGR03936 family radical SAM-associated protein [Lachnospiraceae bacterium]